MWNSRKPKRDKTFKDGRTRLANKSNLRHECYVRAQGRCEKFIDGERCNKNAPEFGPWWIRGQMAHKAHGSGRRDDKLSEVLWECPDCHQVQEHNPKPCPSKPKISLDNVTDV